jgi:hypothetical protein
MVLPDDETVPTRGRPPTIMLTLHRAFSEAPERGVGDGGFGSPVGVHVDIHLVEAVSTLTPGSSVPRLDVAGSAQRTTSTEKALPLSSSSFRIPKVIR